MPNQYDAPDMGIDYGQLSRIAAPQMMPNAPLGAGGMAGQMYYDDKDRQSQFIQRAAQLADLQAKMKATEADNYSAGQPGRLADINTNNALSKGKEGTLPDLLDTQRTNASTESTKARNAKIEAEMEKLNKFANSWTSATNSESKSFLRSEMKSNGVDKLGSKNLDDIPDEKLDLIMKDVYARQINTPAQAQKMQVEGTKGVARATVQGEYALARTQLQMAAKEKVAELAKQGKEANQKWEEEYLRKSAAGMNTELEDQVYATKKRNEQYAAMLRGTQSPPQVNPDIANTPGQPPVLAKPPMITPAAMPKAPKKVDGWSIDGSGVGATKATKEGKTVAIHGYNPKTGEYLLEDGTIIK